MITLHQLTKSYDGKVAVDAIDLHVPAGSICGLIGPNGAGKTTTLKMISTLIKPDEGEITVCGIDLTTDARPARRLIGYMPDQFGTFRGITCREYLEFFGRAYGLGGPGLAARIAGVLDLTDLGAMEGELATSLSAGMRQRLALAKTLLHDPRVLVLDEPASGLDPRARIEIRSLLLELGKMGKTIVISSHILADLEEICSDIAIIELGKLVWGGSLDAVREELRAQRFDIVLEVSGEAEARASEILKALPCVEKVTCPGGRIEAKMAGRHGNTVLRALIDGGVEIRSFSEQKINLEAIFLEQTRGIVS